MMTHAYQEIYLNKAQSIVGDIFDYGINVLNISGNDLIKLFIVSSASKRIESGEFSYFLGKSGIEILVDILEETTKDKFVIDIQENFIPSKEYWIGWAATYYQWYSDRKYSEIFRVVSFEDMTKMYYMLHEADISKFAEIVGEKVKKYYDETNLKRIRTTYGYTQSELSRCSGVSLRSIQMYEQRNKNINKASVDTMYNLSKTLGCRIEDLIEKGC